MKFNFKIQQYQTDAVESVVRVFNGQRCYTGISYIRDLGIVKKKENIISFPQQLDAFAAEPQVEYKKIDEYDEMLDLEDKTGFKNEIVELSDELLLRNIHAQQQENNIKQSASLIKDLGCCSLDVEMETGTGKTYVYIKTMFELNKLYGWSKFIVVVPSIAIREGVKKTFEITAEHFMEQYGKKARFFVYNSSNLIKIDEFSSSATVNVMIINTQAFAASLKEGGRGKESRIIYSEQDDFGSRRPIDVIKANRPIIILDEPQKMGGDVTQKALKNFNPLFTLNYSATHAKKNNMVYVLDALDAYNKRLVKKIEVKGFEVKNLKGTDKYLYLESIVLSSKKPPVARIELEVQRKDGTIKRETRKLDIGDKLSVESNGLEQYKDLYISEINPLNASVTLSNGEVLHKGEVVGDIAEKDMRRIQIRETILSHFEKEERLFKMGIKTISLFFIDEVAKYRIYNEGGEEALGEYGQIFEQEYNDILNERLTLFTDEEYQQYLRKHSVEGIHKGYFSIDKKGRSVNSDTKRGSDISDDISAYDLILKNKERLLSFDEPTRFIFSHSALREGWDNPNVFQICTLKHSDSTTVKRQEVGRGLRLSVNQSGTRMDADSCGDSVHDVNMLTVIASESYTNFVTDLQKQIKEVLYDRPTKATVSYFEGKSVKVGEELVVVDARQAKLIYKYLLKNDYIDDDDNVTDEYRTDAANNCLVALPEDLQPIATGVHTLVQSIFDESVLNDMINDGNETKIPENKLNDNFYKKEFQTLWKYINHQYTYSVSFDSEELINNSVKSIDDKLFVTQVSYTVEGGKQRENLDANELERGASFDTSRRKTHTLKNSQSSQVKYDLVGKIAEGTTLTRRTAATILQKLNPMKLEMFKYNPEEFISKVVRLIKEQKANMIVEKITYNTTDGVYDSSIFTAGKNAQALGKAFHAKKHVQDYVLTDGTAEKSIERKFAEDLDVAEEVCVYAKLPKGFAIPTPMGNYSPDWAIAFNEGAVKHIYFIAETKGTMESLQLRPIEQAKIACAKKLFNELSTSNVKYHDVDSYESLLNVIRGMK